MLNRITKVAQRRSNKRTNNHNSEGNNYNSNLPHSKNNPAPDIRKKNSPNSLLSIIKINFNTQNRDKNQEALKSNKSLRNIDQVMINEDLNNGVMTKNIKIHKVDDSKTSLHILNKKIMFENNTPESSEIDSSVKASRNSEVSNSVKINKTSHDKYRTNINKAENEINIKIKDLDKIYEHGNNENETKKKQSPINNKIYNNEKKIIINETINKNLSKSIKESILDQRKCVSILKDEINSSNKGISIDKTNEIHSDKEKKIHKSKKKQKNKIKSVEISESEIYTRIRQNLLNLYEKQKNNRYDRNIKF